VSLQHGRLSAFFLLLLSLIAAGSIPDEPPPAFLAKWGSEGTGDHQFKSPTGIAVDASGNVYVTDTRNYRVKKLDAGGTLLRMWGWGVQDGTSTFQVCTSGCREGISGGGNGQFDLPYGIAVNASGHVFVADQLNNRIQKFDKDGTYLLMWGWVAQSGPSTLLAESIPSDDGTTRADNGQLVWPHGLTIGPQGYIWVADTRNHRIQKFDAGGTFLAKLGTNGHGDGEFDEPADVAVDSSGNVYVADTNNYRIQKFGAAGQLLTKWGSLGSGNGQFNKPVAVDLDAAGNVYVVDSQNDRVQKFDEDGNFLTKWGSEGSGAGQFFIPFGATIDALGNVFVADTSNHRIQIFGPALELFVGEPEPPFGH